MPPPDFPDDAQQQQEARTTLAETAQSTVTETTISNPLMSYDGKCWPELHSFRINSKRGCLFKQVLISTVEPDLPSKEQILRARAKRQRMRDLGEFIPIEETSSLEADADTDESLHSRLVREEELDRETFGRPSLDILKFLGSMFVNPFVISELYEDHQGSRIAFGDPRERERRQKVTLYEQIQNAQREDEGDDDELHRWELEQIRKGVRSQSIIKKEHHASQASKAKTEPLPVTNNASGGMIPLSKWTAI